MILVTGGLGFIGTHTATALLDLGESCVLVQRRAGTEPPDFLRPFLGKRLFVERADLADPAALAAVGARHRVTGIVHLAGSVPWPPTPDAPVDAARNAVGTLLNVLHAARSWGVRRVVAASTIGVYAGVAAAGPLAEDLPLPMTAGHAIPAFKKIGELLADHLAGATGLDVVTARVCAVWGPLGRPTSVFLPAPPLVHAAARDTAPDLSALYSPAHLDDTHDMLYAKDCGRALALLQLAGDLDHRTYNVGSGRAGTNRELLAALREFVPDPHPGLTLPAGRAPGAPERPLYLDTTRLRRDTGFAPAFTTTRAVGDYLAWLRAGHDR
jgi:UDP-glucose 4-epimerase